MAAAESKAGSKAGSKGGGGGAGADGEAVTKKKAPTLSITNVLLMKEAESRGWKTHILNLAQDMVLLYPPAPDAEILIRRATTELTTALGAVIAHDKNMTYTMAEHAGVPYPASLLFDDDSAGWAAAIRFVSEHKHCVVKPTDRAHGDGVSTEVKDEASLRKAIAFAKLQSPNIVIQRWVGGVDYRIVVLNNKVVAAAHRRPVFVVGDGKSTIHELVVAKNSHPWRGTGHTAPLTTIDITEIEQYLASTDRAVMIPAPAAPTQLTLNTVLAAGTDVELLGTANLSRGGEAIDVTDLIHPDTCALAVRIASACQLGLVGVDFRCGRDISAPPSVSNPSLLEINLTPGLRMHHYPSPSGGGKPRNVASQVLDEILRRRRVWAFANTTLNSALHINQSTTATAAATAAAHDSKLPSAAASAAAPAVAHPTGSSFSSAALTSQYTTGSGSGTATATAAVAGTAAKH